MEPYLWVAPSSVEDPVVAVALEATWWEFALAAGFEEGPVGEEAWSGIAYRFAMEKLEAELVGVGAAES